MATGARTGPTVEEILDRDLLSVVFQPIVTLATRTVVAHEALARGPQDDPLHHPLALFAAARTEGLTRELDAACLALAINRALGLGLRTVFLNAEPKTFAGPPDLPTDGLQIVVEVTERGVTDRPARLLAALEQARSAGWAVALDDVGADWRSLAMLPVLAPDIIKLDRSVLAGGANRENSRVLRAARAHVDRRGGLLLAEGVEDDAHAQRAIGFGASLGQGFRFGRGAKTVTPPGSRLELSPPQVPAERRLTPFEMLQRDGIATAVGTKREMLVLAEDIELSVAEQHEPAILLGTFQTEEFFVGSVRERYSALAAGDGFVAVFGQGMSPAPAPGVLGVALHPLEPLVEEWVVIAIGPHQSSALIAYDLGDEVDDIERRFAYALLSDREIIERAARSLMLRVGDDGPPAGGRDRPRQSR